MSWCRTMIPLSLWLACSGCSGQDDVPPAYRRMAVPEAVLASPEARDRGRTLFREHCAICHGERADGAGVRRAALSAAAADFTSPAWRARMTPRRAFAVVREGLRGTSMPAWRTLSDEETWSLVAYVLSVSRQGP
jgi:mono/diheme cytochrome c family protein